MILYRLRNLVLVLLAFALTAVGCLFPGAARADTALFRAEQRWHGFPNPPVTPGNAGLYIGYIKPYILDTPVGKYNSPPSEAIVAPGNPVGGAFTLPQSFHTSMWTGTLTPKTAWPGYTTTYFYWVYNGPGKFEPGFGSTASHVRMVFPTTGGNPIPNYGLGNPVTPTTTFDGRYDHSRDGSITVTPGPNRFGGTFKLFFWPEAHWEMYVYYFTPALYEGWGYYFCFDDGMYDCTPDTFVSEPGTTAIYQGALWLLTPDGKARATTPIPGPRYATQPTPTPYGNASYLRADVHHLNLIHPWTTGFAAAHMAQPNESGFLHPRATGYDIKLDDATISVKKYNWAMNWNKTLQTLTTTTSTPYTQILTGVTRVVSMVRPRLVWMFYVPLNPSVDPITNNWTPVRLWTLKVFFLPEPTGLLLLGAGLGCLVVLHRLRRRD